jgi:8-oxo-dGTP pyrophosphatase MutT (NUDIX family)
MSSPNDDPVWRRGQGDLTLDLADIDKARFNFRVGVILTRRSASELLLHRDKSGFCFLPGGRVSFGETAAETARRESHEEFGLQDLDIAFTGQVENFFVAAGFVWHEVMQLFRADLSDAQEARVVHEASTSSTPHWMSWSALQDLDLRPAILRDALQHAPSAPLFLTNRDLSWHDWTQANA